jgi:glycosyltransferase involved in cell wall biosynthesis
MFPHPKQPSFGPFIIEQVRALRAYEDLDAHVVCGRPFWVNNLPLTAAWRAFRAYRHTFAAIRWESYEGVPVLYVPYLAGGYIGFALQAATYRYAVLRAARRIRAWCPFQVIHAHTSYLDGSAGLALRRKYHTPFVITEHTGPFRLLTDGRWVRRETFAALRGADRVWCVSRDLAGQVKTHFPQAQDKVDTLPNGVDADLFRPPARWSPDPSRPRLLAAMSLDENKNPLLLLRAFQRLRRDVPGATLTVVGTGPLEAPVRALVKALGLQPAVRLLGYRARPDLARLMREECDIFVLSSNSETFGVVLIEALASGKPVVATACGGPADIVAAPWLGRLCPPGNEAALAATLAAMVRDLPTIEPARLRRHAVEQFDYRRLARTLSAAYEDLFARSQTA